MKHTANSTIKAAPCNRSKSKAYTLSTLVIACFLAGCHYTFGEWVFSPSTRIFRHDLFWTGFCVSIFIPFCFWLIWMLILCGDLKVETVILWTSIVVCLGDLISVGIYRCMSVFVVAIRYDYWNGWTYWMPFAVIAANMLLILRRNRGDSLHNNLRNVG
jgi:hypothetical protein